MNKHRTWYRTKDGLADYEFSFEEQRDGTWRAYILSQPSYRGRAEDDCSTHRVPEKRGRRYICWSGPLGSLDEAKRVAALWADATQLYIAEGVFPTPEEAAR